MPQNQTAGARRKPDASSRKSSQQERLIAGMVTTANRDGCAGASVSAVIGEAGVSRPTFYDYFDDRDDCFRAAIASCQDHFLAAIGDAVRAARPENALSAAAEGIFAFVSARPDEARFLMSETLAGGPSALDARDRGIVEAATVIEHALNAAAVEELVPDLPVAAVIGALQRMLAARLRRGEQALTPLADEVAVWLQSYGRPAGQLQRRQLKPHDDLPMAGRERIVRLSAPPSLPPGRPSVSRAEVIENHRRRIICAAAQVVWERGFGEATIAEITRVAGVDGRTFYRLFADKQSVAAAIHELGFQSLLAATSNAFFTGGSWPDRVWDAFATATQTIDHNPAIAHVAFVEAHAVGPRCVQRVEDSRLAFALFLEEGHHQEASIRVSRSAMEGIVATVFEIIYAHLRANPRRPQTSRLVAHLAHLSLTPFIGASAAAELAEQRLTKPAHHSQTRARSRRPPLTLPLEAPGRGRDRAA